MLLTYALVAALARPTAQPPSPTATPQPTRTVVQLTNQELIERLPPACQEEVRDPRTGTWVKNPASLELASRIQAKRVSPDELAAALKASGFLRSSPTWVQGRPYHVWLRMPAWLPGEDVTATPKLQGKTPGLTAAHSSASEADRMGCGNAIAAREEEESWQQIGVLPTGTRSVDFVVQLTPSKYWGGPGITQTFEVSLPVDLIPDDPSKPEFDGAFTAALKSEIPISISCYPRGEKLYVHSQWRRPLKGPFTSMAVCMEVTVLKAGRVLVTDTLPDPDEFYGMADWRTDAAKDVPAEAAKDIAMRTDLDRYTVRVRGISPASDRWCRTRYWAGEFELKLADVLEP